jgi:hypothetical protein
VVDDDAKEALAIAVEWATEGRTEIRILAGSQVYTAEDFAAAIVIRDFGSSAANGPCVLAAASLRRLETIGTAGRFHAMSGQWTERLQCPRCGASGLAQLFQADDEDTPRVVAVEGFIATPTTSGVPMFRCTNCGSLAKP